MLSKLLFGLEPPDIKDGTVLQYSSGSLPRLCEDTNSITGFNCYCTTQLPLDSGESVTIYRKPSIFGKKKYYATFKGQKVEVTLYK